MIVTFITEQGGVGKTSMCFNLAWRLAEKGKKVLMVDTDPQGGNLSSFAGVPDLDECAGLYELLKMPKRYNPGNTVLEVRENLYIIPANESATGISDCVKCNGNVFCFRDTFDMMEGEYDYIFIDTSPTPSIVHIAALSSSDGMVIPIQPDGKSIEGTKHIIDTCDMIRENYNPGLRILGLVYNNWGQRTRISRASFAAIERFCKEKDIYITDSKIAPNISITEIPLVNCGITEYAPKSKGAACYISLCEELFGV